MNLFRKQTLRFSRILSQFIRETLLSCHRKSEKVKGSYAAAYLCTIQRMGVAARKESPSGCRSGKGREFLASDVTALLKNSGIDLYAGF